MSKRTHLPFEALTPFSLLSSDLLNFSFSSAAQVRERKEREALDKQRERGAELEQVGGADGGEHEDLGHDHLDLDQEEHEGEQWGKAGPGGAYWRPCAVTGQGFLDKMIGTAEGHQWTTSHPPAILSFHSPNVRLRSDLKCKVLP